MTPRVETSAPEMMLQLQGYRLTTAEILYHMPDHPGLLQSFVWQHYDIAPQFPELTRFLKFWGREIEGRLHSVRVGVVDLIKPSQWIHGQGLYTLQ